MNKTTAEEIAKAAAKEAVAEYIKEKQKEDKARIFRNTKLLMRNYNNIKSHVEKGIADAADMELNIKKSGLDPDELFIYSIKKSKFRSLIMLAHVDSCLAQLEREEELKGTLEKYLAYTYYYIDNMSFESIGQVCGCYERTARRWVDELDRTMGVLLFGVDSLQIAD